MPDPRRVVVDGTSSPESKRSPRAVPLLLAVGLMAVIGFAVLVFGFTSGGDEPVAVSTSVQEASEPTSPRYGVTSVSPEFPDAVVAVVSGSQTTAGGPIPIDHVLWPSEAPEVVIPLLEAPQLGPSSIDATGSWVVVSTIDPTTSLLDISLGRRASIESIGNTANSFAFHDSAEGRLGYSVVEDGQWGLRTVTGAFQPQAVPTSIPLEGLGFVASWGDWGWAIQEYGSDTLDPVVWMLDPEGSIVQSFTGIAYGSHPSGLLVVSGNSGVGIVEVSSGETVAFFERTGSAPLAAASISPDKSKAALLDFDKLVVISLDNSEIVMDADPIVGWAQVVWSSDSRFVMVPGPTGISIVDTVTESLVEGFGGLSVQAVGVIPLTRS